MNKVVRISRRRLLTKAAKVGVGAVLTGTLSGIVRPARAQQTTVRVLMVPQHRFETYDRLFAEFGRQKNVRVVPEYLEFSELRAKILASAAGGESADVAWDFNWTQEMAMIGLLHPLTEYLKRDGREIGFPNDWLPLSVERQVYQTALYGLQNFYTNHCLFYNVKMFRDAGIKEPPQTWDEFLEAALKTTKRSGDRTDVWGFVSVYRFLNGFMNWYFQAGAKFYDQVANKMLTDSAESAAAFQFFQDLHWKHKVAPLPVVEAGVANPRKTFTSGRAAMILSGPWDLKPMKDEITRDFQYAVAPPPKGKVRATVQAGTGINILKNSSQKDLAWELTKRMLSLETMLSLTKEADFLFARRSWGALPEVKNNATLKTFADARAYAVDWNAGIRLTGKGQIQTTMLQALLDEVTFNRKPVRESVQGFTESANKILRE